MPDVCGGYVKAALSPPERVQIGDEVAGILGADGEAQRVGVDAGLSLLISLPSLTGRVYFKS
jgi:hypothetical protein